MHDHVFQELFVIRWFGDVGGDPLMFFCHTHVINWYGNCLWNPDNANGVVYPSVPGESVDVSFSSLMRYGLDGARGSVMAGLAGAAMRRWMGAKCCFRTVSECA